MNRKNLVLSLMLIALILSACGARASTSEAEPTSGPDLALTVTAQALLLEGLTQTALAPTSTPESTHTSTPVITATPSLVTVTVSANTNCRSGPGGDYSIEGALTVGQQATVVGKNSLTNYWIIENPIGPGICWLWGEHATINGDPAGLQEVAAPPTVTPRAVLSPVIDSVAVRFDSSSGSVLVFFDVYFSDGEGDANYLDWQFISASINTSGTIKDSAINPSPNQRKGSVVTSQWNCGSKVYDVALAVTIRDAAGHSSNAVSVNFSCNRN